MRKRKMVVKGLKKPRTPDEVLGLLVEGLATVLSARKSGSAVGEHATSHLQVFAEAMKELEPREALHILWMEPAELHVAQQLVPIDTFPTKKVRFNVFPQSEDKLARVKQYKEDGKATMKDAVDTVLECLLNQLPSEYWDHKADVVTLLAGHLPSPGGERPVSLAMNSLMYAFLQEVAEMLGQSQGAVLEAAAEMWLTDHKRRVVKREEALKIITQLSSTRRRCRRPPEEDSGRR